MSEQGKRPTINLDGLSKRAIGLAGAWFGMMGKNSSVTHHLRELRPTAETRAVLEELIGAGVISEEPFNQFGGVVYRPLVDCFPAYDWMRANSRDPDLKFRLMEPVNGDQST